MKVEAGMESIGRYQPWSQERALLWCWRQLFMNMLQQDLTFEMRLGLIIVT